MGVDGEAGEASWSGGEVWGGVGVGVGVGSGEWGVLGTLAPP